MQPERKLKSNEQGDEDFMFCIFSADGNILTTPFFNEHVAPD